jgi:putative transposase
VARSSVYYQAAGESTDNLALMRLLDEQYTRTPFYGVRRMTEWLHTQGHAVNHKRVARLLRVMGIEAIYPRKRLSQPAPGHQVYPYLLRGVAIERPDQVWSTDITYIRLRRGFAYLVAVLDWYSRYVLSWELSATLETGFCLAALERALGAGAPEIFNTDQGSQFTSADFTGRLQAAGIAISMDGRGRALDNVFVKRLWRTVKYEEVYLLRRPRRRGQPAGAVLPLLQSRAAAPGVGLPHAPAGVPGGGVNDGTAVGGLGAREAARQKTAMSGYVGRVVPNGLRGCRGLPARRPPAGGPPTALDGDTPHPELGRRRTARRTGRNEECEGTGTTSAPSHSQQEETNDFRTENCRRMGYTSIIDDDELTPVFLKDGRLDGWGWSYWQTTAARYDIRIRVRR